MARSGINVLGRTISSVDTRTGTSATYPKKKKKKPIQTVEQPQTAVERFQQMLETTHQPQVQTPQAPQQPTSTFTQQLQAEQMSQSLGLTASQQTTNPFQAGFTPPPQSAEAPTSQSAYAKAEVWTTKKINQAFGFIESLGGGDFQRGVYSLITTPLMSTGTLAKGIVSGKGMGSSAANLKRLKDIEKFGKMSAARYAARPSSIAAKNAPAVITENLATKGGVKVLDSTKKWYSKLLTKESIITYTNAATGKARTVIQTEQRSLIKPLMAVGAVLGIGAMLVKDGLGGHATGQRDVQEEAGGMIGMYARDMLKAGNIEGYYFFSDMAREAINDSVSKMPFGAGVIEGAAKYADYVDRSLDYLDKYVADEQIKVANGEGTEQYWERINAQKLANDTFLIEKQNSERIATEKEIIALREQAASISAGKRKDEMLQQAQFWLTYQQQLIDMQKAEREAQATFWFEYKKLIIKMQQDNAPSNLKFGLL